MSEHGHVVLYNMGMFFINNIRRFYNEKPVKLYTMVLDKSSI